MENNMLEYMAELIQADLDETGTDLYVEYDGNNWFTFEGRYARVMVEVYSEYDTFNFGEATFTNGDQFNKDDTNEALTELKIIFDIIKENDGVTVLM